ncbi:D-cysteine desulfhydrase family protein [candidate division KSB1 bacterium]
MNNKGNNTSDFTRRQFLGNTIRGGIGIAAFPTILSVAASCGTTRTVAGPGRTDPFALTRTISNNFRRREIAHIPTPLEEMKVLSAEFRGPKIYMKRDDQTGLAFGGNKTRKLEYIIPDVLRKRADTIVTYAGVQSNWCRQTAAAATKSGLNVVLVLSKKETAQPEYDGNLLLDEIFGADVRFVEPGESRTEVVDRIAAELTNEGRTPYVIPVGGSSTGGSMLEPFGAISYTNAFLELYTEAKEQNITIDYIVHPTGSGGTQAGLVAGAMAVDPKVKIVGISIGGAKEEGKRGVAAITDETAGALGLNFTVPPEEVIIFDEYVGEGYGIINQGVVDAISMTAQKEGILLDPVYTGKAMAGMFDLIRTGYFGRDDTVVFLHTGGTPALFPYKDQLMEYIKGLRIGRNAPGFLPF